MPATQVMMVVLLGVLLCTLHLCVGIWIGRQRQAHRSTRTSRLSGEALQIAAQEFASQRSATRQLDELAQELFRTSTCHQAIAPSLSRAIEQIAGTSAEVRQHVERAEKLFSQRVAALAAAAQDEKSKPPQRAKRRRQCEKRSASLKGAPSQPRPSAVPLPPELHYQRHRSEVPVLDSGEIASLAKSHEVNTSTAAQTRHAYDTYEYAAPLDDGQLPAAEAFQPVRCHDISGDGISYFVEDAPQYDTVVISVGHSRRNLFVIAKVGHSRAAYKYGRVGYLVGCQFLQRLDGKYRWDADANVVVSVEEEAEGATLLHLGA
jgi:hypothetical protein